jgi:hypothetical protein
MLLDNKEVMSVLEDVKHADYVWVAGIHQYTELVHKKIIKGWLLAE